VRGRLAWVIVGAVSTVIMIVTAGTGLWFLTSFDQHNQTTRTTRYSIAQHGGRLDQLTVQLSNGDITIVGGPAGQVSVTGLLQWTSTKPVIDEYWDKGELNIDQGCPTGLFDQDCSVSIKVTVPPGVPLHLTTGSGDITTTGIRSANVQASSGDGDIELGFAATPTQVNAQTGSGDVTVKVPHGASYVVVDVADNGTPSVEVTRDPGAPRSITAESSDGDVTIGYN
jgi:hypothetical protein